MAKACCDYAIAVFGELDSHTRVAEAYKFLGRVSSQQKKWDEAGGYFERSIQINDSVNNPLGAAEARYEYGLMYLRQGLKDNAKQQFTAALEIFDKLGASLDVQKVKAELAKLEGAKEESSFDVYLKSQWTPDFQSGNPRSSETSRILLQGRDSSPSAQKDRLSGFDSVVLNWRYLETLRPF